MVRLETSFSAIDVVMYEMYMFQAYQDFLEQSALDICPLPLREGHWRNILVRSNEKGHVLASVCFHQQQQPSVSTT